MRKKSDDMFVIDVAIICKLCLTTILGLVIGIEREIRRKPVGLKTSLVISLVSCLLTIVSIETSYQVAASENANITMDPLRLAAQIVSGIGFLGAGVILRKGNETISGLTTAALIWGAAGVGIAVGAGFYFEAIIGVAFLLVSVEVIPILMKYFGPNIFRKKEINIKLFIRDNKNIDSVLLQLKELQLHILHTHITDIDENTHCLQLLVSTHYKNRITHIYSQLLAHPNIKSIEIESRI